VKRRIEIEGRPGKGGEKATRASGVTICFEGGKRPGKVKGLEIGKINEVSGHEGHGYKRSDKCIWGNRKKKVHLRQLKERGRGIVN